MREKRERDGKTLSDEWLALFGKPPEIKKRFAALRAQLAELHRAIDTDGSLAELPPSEQREAFLTIAQDGAHALSRSGALVAENERLRAQLADANKRIDELETARAASGKEKK